MAFATAILLGLAAASAMWVGMTISRRAREIAALTSQGNAANAQIKRVSTSGSLEPRISYTFTVNGTVYSGEARVPKSLVPAMSRAASLPIRYLPANPALNHPAGWEQPPHSDFALLMAPVIAALLALSLLLPLILERRMAAHGRPALAMVKKCTPSRSGYLVKYEFRPEGEGAVKGRGWFQYPQQPGEGVWVLYLPGNPRRSLPYPLSCCKVADWAD